MNNLIKTSIFTIALGFVCLVSNAQNEGATKTQKDENIIIHKKGSSNENLTIVVEGNNVTVNGKPLDEFKNNDIEIFSDENAIAPMLPPGVPRPPLPPHGGAQMFDDNFISPMKTNAAFLGVTTNKSNEGAIINEVSKESPAEKAGLLKNDIITKIGNTKIETSDDLYKAIGIHKPSDKVIVTYRRNGKENSATVILAKHSEDVFFNNNDFNFKMNSPEIPGTHGFIYNTENKHRIGIQIQDTEDGNGVKVMDVDDDSPAGKADLKENDIIMQVNGEAIKSVDDFKDILNDVKDGDTFTVQYKRDDKLQTATIKFPKELKTADL